MELTSTPLLIGLAVLALAGPVVLVLTWRRLPRRVVGGVVRFLAIVLCEALTVAALGVAVNRHFGFYESWNDLLGRRTTGPVKVTQSGQLVPADGSLGRVAFLDVHGKTSGVDQQVLVWLPPQYDQQPKADFPVLLTLPGQPGTTTGIFRTFDLAKNAMKTITSGEAKPFIAVIASLDIAPPRDTECTDVPRGPQGDSWLSVDVKDAVDHAYRTGSWSAMGWSTGGFCAAKMLLRHPKSFVGAASIGAYFGAVEDDTTGVLFDHDDDLRNANSPLYLLQHTRTYPVHLLVVSAKTDFESWRGAPYADAEKAVAIGTGVPGFNAITLASGGHNFATYGPTIEPTLAWLGDNAGL